MTPQTRPRAFLGLRKNAQNFANTLWVMRWCFPTVWTLHSWFFVGPFLSLNHNMGFFLGTGHHPNCNVFDLISFGIACAI